MLILHRPESLEETPAIQAIVARLSSMVRELITQAGELATEQQREGKIPIGRYHPALAERPIQQPHGVTRVALVPRVALAGIPLVAEVVEYRIFHGLVTIADQLKGHVVKLTARAGAIQVERSGTFNMVVGDGFLLGPEFAPVGRIVRFGMDPVGDARFQILLRPFSD